jgi:hypothetical protein
MIVSGGVKSMSVNKGRLPVPDASQRLSGGKLDKSHEDLQKMLSMVNRSWVLDEEDKLAIKAVIQPHLKRQADALEPKDRRGPRPISG